MPRPSREQSSGAEANLARRIKYERERRGLSHEALAKLMTDAGCKVQGSAIYKIETPNKDSGRQRRITVDELAALSSVLDIPVSDLLVDMELIEQRRAHELIGALQRNHRNLYQVCGDVFAVVFELDALVEESPELGEYVANFFAANPSGLAGEEDETFLPTLFRTPLSNPVRAETTTHRDVAAERIMKALRDFREALDGAALLWVEGDRGDHDSDDRQAALRAELRELRGEGD